MTLLRMIEAEASAYSTQRLDITDDWVEHAVSAYGDFDEAVEVEGGREEWRKKKRRWSHRPSLDLF